MVEVITLGTGGPLPSPDRAGPSTLVRSGNRSFLVDAGRGVQLRLSAAFGAVTALDAVLLTHLHSDHICDLNDVITTRWIMAFGPSPLTIYGPVGTAALVDRTMAMLTDDIGYRIAHHDDLTEGPIVNVVEVTSGVIVDDGVVRIIAAPTDHAPASPSVGYRFEIDGTVVAVAGDTIPCAGLDLLVDGADCYVQTVVREALIRPLGLPRFLDVLDYHSSTVTAAQTAAKGGVKHLIFTHPVPAPQPGTEGEWLAEAAAHFSGPVDLAADLFTWTN
jgi:ribonuclease Z